MNKSNIQLAKIKELGQELMKIFKGKIMGLKSQDDEE